MSQGWTEMEWAGRPLEVLGRGGGGGVLGSGRS